MSSGEVGEETPPLLRQTFRAVGRSDTADGNAPSLHMRRRYTCEGRFAELHFSKTERIVPARERTDSLAPPVR